MEDQETLLTCVKHLVATIPLPITVKVRLLPKYDDPHDNSVAAYDLEQSLNLYQRLVDAGIHMLTVHGRTRHQLHVHTGAADWTAIRTVVEKLGDRIPIFANGNIGSMTDVARCFAETGADGVMSSEAILEYPALFAGDDIRLGRIQMAREYLQLAKQYPPEEGHQGSGIKCLKAHIHRMLHPDLEAPEGTHDYQLRQRVAGATSWQELWDIVDHVEGKHLEEEHKVEEEQLSWYMRHRITVVDALGNTMPACELKYLRDQGLAMNATDGYHVLGEPQEEDPDKAAAYTFFDNGGDNDGDY